MAYAPVLNRGKEEFEVPWIPFDFEEEWVLDKTVYHPCQVKAKGATTSKKGSKRLLPPQDRGACTVRRGYYTKPDNT